MKTINKSSGIKGVTFKSMNGGKNLYWCAQVQGRIHKRKYFPFTDEGKEMAAKFYNRTIEENKDKYYQYRERLPKTIKKQTT